MNLLHTSDWHLGRQLHNRSRYDEHEAFLEWLLETLDQEKVDVLIVAGDVFDTSTPSNRSQNQYYRFLAKAAATCCRHIVVVGGNHDSPTFLDAPNQVLEALSVHVVGKARETVAEQVLVLRGSNGAPEAIVCAVPYLRDREIRSVEAGESIDDKGRKLVQGIRNHYARVADAAKKALDALDEKVPLIATGHLFASGGSQIEGDGVRNLYVGSAVHVNPNAFSNAFDYVALGHLHVAQMVGQQEHVRYSGAPLPMGFGEANRQKSVNLVSFADDGPQVEPMPIPRFQQLAKVDGDWSALSAEIEKLNALNESVWVEATYTGSKAFTDLGGKLRSLTEDTSVEILRVIDRKNIARALSAETPDEALDDLTPDEVFERCLDAHGIPDDERALLSATYHETLTDLQEADTRAE